MSFFSSLKRLAVRQSGRRQTPVARRSRRAAPGVEGLEDRFAPAVLTVTSLADSVSSPAAGTLRAAVLQADSDAVNAISDTIQFAAGLKGTITLGAPLELTPGTATISGGGAMLTSVTINGSPGLTLSGGGTSEVFRVDAGAWIVFNGLTISHGSATQGGAIFNAGTLTLNSDTLSGNTATSGGAVYNAGSASLYLNGSTLSGNAAAYGGAIDNESYASLIVYNGSTLSGNAASQYGGGIYNQGWLTIDASTLSGNSAVYGGALCNRSSAFVESNSTLSNDRATCMGGAVDNYGSLSISGGSLSCDQAAYGGAVANEWNSSLYITGATLSANGATWCGGAVYNQGQGSIVNSVLNSNSSYDGGALVNYGTLTLNSDTLAGNAATFGGAIYNNGTLTMSYDAVYSNTALEGGGIWNGGSLSLSGDELLFNRLRSATAWDYVYAGFQPQGSGLFNASYGSVHLNGAWIAYNLDANGYYGGDTVGV